MQSLKEEIIELLEKDKEFRYAVAGLIGYKELLDRIASLEEGQQRLEERIISLEERILALEERIVKLEEGQQRLEEEFRKLAARVEVTIGSMGRRWGSDLEMMVLELFRELLEDRGIEPGQVRKFRFKDESGEVAGVKGRMVDVDVLVKDSKLYVIEVKSRAELDHVEYLPEKVRFVENIMGMRVDDVIVVAVNVDKEAYERAKELVI
ncbi:MAG: DUF3782 domain-containing protein, partial [Candidatus Korarchaeota archaeon]|nr:DUF3782 domain-containing protein [Candidatus Korarchaeota archaeon]